MLIHLKTQNKQYSIFWGLYNLQFPPIYIKNFLLSDSAKGYYHNISSVHCPFFTIIPLPLSTIPLLGLKAKPRIAEKANKALPTPVRTACSIGIAG